MDSPEFRSRLSRLMGEARERALERGQRVLLSLSDRIPSRDPLTVLEALLSPSGPDARLAETASEACSYWTRPAENFAIAAFGAAAILSPSGDERFSAVDHEWRSLMASAVLDGAVSRPALGPILIGGFSFDPDGPRSERWENFPSSHMVLPRAHLTTVGGECWITVSTIVEPESDDANAEQIASLRELLLSAGHNSPSRGNQMRSAVRTFEDQPADEWCDTVRDAVDVIRADGLRKVVLARSVSGSAKGNIDAVKVLRHLRSVHRDAFVFGYWRSGDVFVGASPERLVRLDGRRITASSLAGTIRRGATPEDDAILARELQTSEKDLAEHAAVREMLHDVLSEFDENVESSETPDLLTLSNVHHLHTEVRAKLDERDSILDVVARLHPTPAVGGTPRSEALAFIEHNEKLDRGWYAAPVGWMDRNCGEFAVALRSGLIRGSEFTIFAGCGIVADSDPDLELAESNLKLQPMRSAIAASLAVNADDAEMALASRDAG